MATAAEQISQIYVGYFNRAPDPAGLQYWITQLNNGMPLGEIADYFATEQETLDLYPYLSQPDLNSVDGFINQIYTNLFNRPADAAGLAFWKGQLESGAVSEGEFIAAIANGATGEGRTVLDNKVAVGVHFATELSENSVVWSATALDAAYQALSGVTLDPNSVVEANAATDSFVATGVWPGTGSDETVQLTIGNDVFTANVFDAPLVVSASNPNTPTLNPGDVLTGAGENPTLNAALNGQAGLSPTLKGIEILNLETVATSTLNAVKATGVEAIAHEAGVAGADLIVRNLSSNAAIAVNNAGVGTDTDIRFANSVVGGVEDVASLTLTNNGSALVTSGVINLRGESAGGFETIDVTANGVNRVTNIGSDNTAPTGNNITGANSVRTLNVDGEGSLRVDNVLQKVTSVDASENEGGVRLSIDQTVVATVLGGSGDDRINFGAGLTNADKYDGGEGRDTIEVIGLNGLGAGNQVSNVEILRVNGNTAGTVNLDNVAGIDALVHNSVNGVTYNNFSAAGAAEDGVTILSTGAVTVGVKGAAAGLFDTLEVTYGDADLGANLASNGLTAANVEKINFHVVASDTNNAFVNSGALTVGQVAGVSLDGGIAGQAFGLGNGIAFGTAGVLSVIDANEFVGDLTVSGNAGAQRIIGGSGNDVISTGGRGAANTPGDTLTGGAGNDDFIFAADDSTAVVPNAASATFTAADLNNFTSITDLNLGGSNAASGVDQIGLGAVNAALNGGVLQVVNGGAVIAMTGANFGAAVDATFNTLGISQAGLYSYGGETFLLASSAANVVYTTGDDIVIRVTGVTGTLDASDFV